MKDKIPFYEVANLFFVGVVFTLFFGITINSVKTAEYYQKLFDLCKQSVLISSALVVIMFEFGLIINRIGSLIIEPVLKMTKIWPFRTPKCSLNAIKRKDYTFAANVRNYGVYRSQVVIWLSVLIASLICKKWWFALASVLLIGLFVLSGRKVCKYIGKRIEKEEKHNAEQGIINV